MHYHALDSALGLQPRSMIVSTTANILGDMKLFGLRLVMDWDESYRRYSIAKCLHFCVYTARDAYIDHSHARLYSRAVHLLQKNND